MSKKRPNPETIHADFLREFLSSSQPTPIKRIEALYAETLEESVYLDYKAADWASPSASHAKMAKVGQPIKFDAKLTKWLAGFANGAGGMLIVGVKEDTKDSKAEKRYLDPIKTIPYEELQDAARRALGQLHPNLPRGHRYELVEHDSGYILLIGLERATHLVLVSEHETSVHYLRIGDSTICAPAYLTEDLQLGRRQKTDFLVSIRKTRYDPKDAQGFVGVIDFEVCVVNVGLTWMDRPQVGIVAYVRKDNGFPIPNALLPSFRIEPALTGLIPQILPMKPSSESINPYGTGFATFSGDSPYTPRKSEFWVAAAMFVVSHGQIPVWYQVLFLISEHSQKLNSPVHTRCWIARCDEEKPYIGVYQKQAHWFRLIYEKMDFTHAIAEEQKSS